MSKPNETICLSAELGRPNQAVVIYSSSLPPMWKLVISMQGASHLSKLYLAPPYNDIPLDPSSRHLAAFMTHEGFFRIMRMFRSRPCTSSFTTNHIKDCKALLWCPVLPEEYYCGWKVSAGARRESLPCVVSYLRSRNKT